MTAIHDEAFPARGECTGPGAAEVCAISVVAPGTQVDVTVPADVPLASLIPELVALVLTRRRAVDPPAGGEDPAAAWVLGPVGRPAWDPALPLAGHGVHDGALLHLRPAAVAVPEPLFDDVVDAVAAAGAAAAVPWGPRAALRVAYGVAVAATLAAVGLLLSHASAGVGTTLPVLIAAAGSTVAAAACCGVLTRLRRDGAAVLGACACAFAFAAGAALPGGGVGAPGVLAGSACALLCSVICLFAGRGGIRIGAAVASASLLTAGAGAVALSLDAGPAPVGAGLMIAALVTVSLGPRLTVLVSRLPMPPVPSRDVRADLAGDAAVADPSADPAREAARAGALLDGITTGGACTAVAAAAAMASDGAHSPWPATALALIAAAVLALRDRTHADALPAAVLVLGGAAVALAVPVVLAAREVVPAAGAAAACAGIGAAALACGAVGTRTGVSPVLRRGVEIAESVLIAAVLPSALWVMGAYAAMRAL